MTTVLVEVCVDTLAGALAAQAGGAQRVELCSALSEGGLTPSAATIELARRHLAIGLNVMIRPRAGDFCYSPLELELMQRDIAVAKSLGADGIVVGALDPDGAVDTGALSVLIAAARPLSVTFHRAFDLAADAPAALAQLIALRVDRVLTSGQAATAPDGAALIADLVTQAAGRIAVMAGGGVNEHNVVDLVRQTHVREVHMSARGVEDSPMRYHNPRVRMGAPLPPSEFVRQVTASDRIHAGIAALAAAGL